MADIFDAVEFAARAHRGQYRKGTRIPYIIHPLAVARTLIECGASNTLVNAALLHDVVEDTPITLDQVRGMFGESVADLVRAVTEPKKSLPWEERKQWQLEHLATASPDVVLLHLADKLDSIRSMHADLQAHGEETWKRFNRGRDAQKGFYTALAALFRTRLTDPCGAKLAQEFDHRVQEVFGY